MNDVTVDTGLVHDQLQALAEGRHNNPFAVLGIHRSRGRRLVRTLQPQAKAVSLIDSKGNVLTPKLVGEKVNLHPAVVIFALLAGGSLFGFTGLLLSMPVAAVIGVLLRFAIDQYLKSPLYGAKCAPLPPPVAPRDDDPTHP